MTLIQIFITTNQAFTLNGTGLRNLLGKEEINGVPFILTNFMGHNVHSNYQRELNYFAAKDTRFVLLLNIIFETKTMHIIRNKCLKNPRLPNSLYLKTILLDPFFSKRKPRFFTKLLSMLS